MQTVYYNIAKINELDQFTLPKIFEHPLKNLSHFLARLCLVRLVNHHTNSNHTPEAIEVIHHNQIKDAPGLTCSLTHTKNFAAAVLGERKYLNSVGIDIELKTRTIKIDSERFFINEFDHFLDISLLLKWCIKESCFKAISNANKDIKLLKEVVINKNSFGLTKTEALSGHNQFEIIESENLYTVIAYCANVKTNIQIQKTNQ